VPLNQNGILAPVVYWGAQRSFGQGTCRMINQYQAQIELYFPGVPMHSGIASVEGNLVVIRGQYGAYSFMVSRFY
jgi:hypothetical protein